jgi:hypothetical protein
MEKPSEPVQISKSLADGPMSRHAESANANANANDVASPPPAPATASTTAAAQSQASPVGRAVPQAARAAAPSALAERSMEKLGTAHGQREFSQVTRTAFERLSNMPQMLEEIHYDSRDNLVAAGVLPPPSFVVSRQARAFPLNEGPRYVPDPPQR